MSATPSMSPLPSPCDPIRSLWNSSNRRSLAIMSPVWWGVISSNGRYQSPPHIQALSKAVRDTINGVEGVRNLMVSMPPRHGKSEFCSKYLPSWFLGTNPDKRVILASYEAKFASSWGRKARNLFEEFGDVFGVEVAKAPSSADQWDIAHNSGGMMTAGVGGAITGKGAHLLIVDDPHKNAEEANSKTIRDSIWDWWQSTAYTRLEPDGAAIVMQTRWHEDDLCGRLLKDASQNGIKWRVLVLPAINDQGEALWPERFSSERLTQIKSAIGEYHWSALYQQGPTAREGSLFRVSQLEIIDAAPAGLREVRAWDIAATAGDGDYTVGLKMGADSEGRYFVLDVTRGQWGTDDRDATIRQTAESDGRSITHRLPEDPGAAGKSQALAFSRLLTGFTFQIERVTGDKVTRADPFSSQVNAGNVKLVRGLWNRDFIEELRQFPRGGHDDQVDAASDAFNFLATGDNTSIVPMGGLDAIPNWVT